MQSQKVVARSLAVVLGAVASAAVVATAGAAPASTWRVTLTTNRAGDSDIYSMNANGTNVRKLTNTKGFDGAGPASPNGRKMLFYRNQGGVWVMNADGSGKRDLTPNRGWNAPGGWSPDGRKIVFASNRDGNNEIYVMNADGTGQRNLVPSPSSQEYAAGWSPDGRTILFVTDRDHNWEIYAVNADGSDPRNLTRNPGNDGGVGGVVGAGWSPDGRKIVFTSTRDSHDKDNPDLFVMNADGSGVRNLTHAPGAEFLLSWSPDGRKLAFGRLPLQPRWSFFVMNADGSGVHKVNWSLPSR
jgi:TolB protein